MKSGNAIGQIRDMTQLLGALAEMPQQLIDGGEKRIWMSGAEIVKIMDDETKKTGNETDSARGQ